MLSTIVIAGLIGYVIYLRFCLYLASDQIRYWYSLHEDLNSANKQFCKGCGERKLRYYPTYSSSPRNPNKSSPMAECLGCGMCQQVWEDNNPYNVDAKTNEELKPFYKVMGTRFIEKD